MSANSSPTPNPELKKQVSRLVQKMKDTSVDDQDAREVFYTHIEKNIVPYASEADCPPIQVLVPVALTILRPTLAYAHIPSLLDIFAQVEHIRQLVVTQSTALLKKVINGKVILGENEEQQREWQNTLRKYASPRSSLEHRESYRLFALTLCRLHIYHLHVTRKEAYLQPAILKQYYPALGRKLRALTNRKAAHTSPSSASSSKPSTSADKESDDDYLADHHWTRMRHADLSPTEREEVHQAGLRMWEFILQVQGWEREREEYFASIGIPERAYENSDDVSYSHDFEQAFPTDMSESRLVEAVGAFMLEIQTRVETLESIDVVPSSKDKGKGRAV